MLADVSDEEALGLGQPCEVDPEQAPCLHAFRDVAGDDDVFTFVEDGVVLLELIESTARRSRGVVEALLSEMGLPRAFDSEMSLTQGDVGQRHERAVCEVGIFEVGVGRYLEGVAVDNQESAKLRGRRFNGLEVRCEPSRLLSRQRSCFLLGRCNGLDHGSGEAITDQEADQWLKDTSASWGGYYLYDQAAHLGRARRLRVESMAEGEGLLG